MKTINFFKTALLTIALFVCGNVGAETATYDWTTQTGTSGNIDENISFTTEKNSSSNPPAYNSKSQEIRFYYASNGNGGSITLIPLNGATISEVTMVASDTEHTPNVKYNIDGGEDVEASLNSTTYTISNVAASSSLKIRNANTTNTQLRIKSITVVYSISADAIATPTFSPQTGKYTEAQNVTIDCATAEASIYYTINGTEPSATSTPYSKAINISSTTTLKAIAIKNGESSAVATATYTFPTEVDNIAAFNQAENNDFVKITKPITVTYINGANVYAQDESGSMLIFDFNFAETEGLAAGATISNLIGTKSEYSGAAQMAEVISSTIGEGAAIPAPTTVTSVTEADLHKYVKLEDAQFNDSYSFTTGYAISAKLSTHGEIIVRNNFKNFEMDVTATDKYDIIGFVNVFTGQVQIYPISINVTTPSITLSTNSLAFETVENNQTKDLTFTVNGANLSENATLAITGENADYFTCNPTSITPAEDGSITETTITVTYQPTATGEHAATLTLTCGDLTKEVALTGTCISPILATPVATEATAITANGFTANWQAVDNATSYELNVWTSQEVLYETFDTQDGTGGNDGQWSGSVASNDVNGLADWTLVNAYGAKECIKLGTGSKQGVATTPVLNIEGNATLTFRAGAWDGKSESTSLLLSLEGTGTLSQTEVSIAKGQFQEYTITLTGISANTKISFKGKQDSDSRFFLDDIKVIEVTPIVGSPFTVEGATSKEITGLTAETTYYYNVVAKADGYTASESNTINVTTIAEVAEPTITITGDDLVETEGMYTVALGETRFSTKTSKTFTLTATGILEPIKIKPEMGSGYFTIISSDSEQASIVEEMDFYGNVNKTLTFTPNETGEINAVCTISNRINSEFADYGVSNGEEMMQMFELTFGTPLTEQWGILYQNQTANITKVITVSLTPTDESTGTGLCNRPEMEGVTFNGEEIINSLNLDVVVYNAIGQMVVRSNENINMSSYPAGVYVIKAANGASMKIVK